MTPGSMVAGRYKVLSEIGRGGMGVVYQVEQVFLKRLFAMKVLTRDDCTIEKNDKDLMRFQKEAQAASLLEHANLIRVHDFGVLDSGAPFLVMDYADGVSLSDRIQLIGGMPVKETLEIFMQVCDGLAFAHEHGIIHRDLKPSNIIICKAKAGDAEVVKIVDFGIAKILSPIEGEAEQALTRTGEIFGSPLYMSPEQCLGQKVDTRSDIYSIGCALFESLTGVTPFVGDNALATMMKHQTEQPPTLRETTLGSKEFPPTLETVMAKILSKDPDKRYQNMTELKGDLKIVSEGGTFDTVKRRRQRFSWIAFAAAVALGAGIASLMLVVYRNVTQKVPYLPPAKLEAIDLRVDRDFEYNLPISDQLPGGDMPDQKFSEQSFDQAKALGKWTFRFPDRPIGRIQTDWSKQEAKGTIVIPKPHERLTFQPSAGMCERPSWFRFWRPDDLEVLDFDWNGSLTDDTLIFIDHMVALEKITLESTEVTDAGLMHIANLPSMKVLSVNNTNSVTGPGLCKMKWLKKLETLRAEHVKNVMPALEQMTNSRTLTTLQVKGCGLSDHDLDTIVRCSHLECLFLNANDHITDAGIQKLTRLKRLKQLDLHGCSITAKCIPSLKRMANLRTLAIDLKSWTELDKAAIKNALPYCDFNRTRLMYGRLPDDPR